MEWRRDILTWIFNMNGTDWNTSNNIYNKWRYNIIKKNHLWDIRRKWSFWLPLFSGSAFLCDQEGRLKSCIVLSLSCKLFSEWGVFPWHLPYKTPPPLHQQPPLPACWPGCIISITNNTRVNLVPDCAILPFVGVQNQNFLGDMPFMKHNVFCFPLIV